MKFYHLSQGIAGFDGDIYILISSETGVPPTHRYFPYYHSKSREGKDPEIEEQGYY
jgi:hypothetical protein